MAVFRVPKGHTNQLDQWVINLNRKANSSFYLNLMIMVSNHDNAQSIRLLNYRNELYSDS